MADKKYTADDIKIIKPAKSNEKLIDISREVFGINLLSASKHALEFARTLVINELPDNVKYVICLGASYDGNPLESGEMTFPEDYKENIRIFEEYEQVINLLWRDGKVPEWINISVVSEEDGYTNVRLDCCGRYSSDPKQIYHAHEGRAPFHVLGPPVPQGVDIEKGQKYTL